MFNILPLGASLFLMRAPRIAVCTATWPSSRTRQSATGANASARAPPFATAIC